MRRVLPVALWSCLLVTAIGTGCGGDGSTFGEPPPGGDSGPGGSSGDTPPPDFGSRDAAGAGEDADVVGDGGTIDDPGAICGDAILGSAEACDDGNLTAGDGCSPTCTVETGYVCLVPGQPCSVIGVCGDSRLDQGETCDDGNTSAGDGCSASCTLEAGWVCPLLGAACSAAACGDGLLAGDEECDDGDALDDNGCTNGCLLQNGYKCVTPGAPCEPTVCGDGAREGSEQCDDGNTSPYDGCSPTCTAEPICPKTGGVCVGTCGDGIVFPGEQCDDGNTRAGDGCSPTCTVEPEFECTNVAQDLPSTLQIPIVLRDFSRGDKPNIPAAGCTTANGCPNGHPDFQTADGARQGMVGGLFNSTPAANVGVLDADGKPVLRCTNGIGDCKATSVQSFAQWYRDVPNVNHRFDQSLSLQLLGPANDRRYEFSSTAFFPLNGLGFGNQWDGSEGGGNRNFHFTSELRFWFYYDAAAPAPQFDFRGDDDVWVFVNGKLAVDIGGVHGATNASLTLNAANATALGLVSGNVYEFALFQAERRRTESNYRVTLRGFVRAKSSCVSRCGDGVKTRFEACDDGAANDTNVPPAAPAYGKCGSDCRARGPYCGDGVVNGGEICDDGVYNGGYGKCNAECTGAGPSCGDGVVQSAYGEICDDGAANDSNVPPAYGKCAVDCRSKPRCGDGVVQAPEVCEPPNTATCTASCQTRSSGPN